MSSLTILIFNNASLNTSTDSSAIPYSLTAGRKKRPVPRPASWEDPQMVGYAKIQGCCDQASRDGWKYAWIDSCCIDQTSSAELSEAINSMFNWYTKIGGFLSIFARYTYLESIRKLAIGRVHRFDRAYGLREVGHFKSCSRLTYSITVHGEKLGQSTRSKIDLFHHGHFSSKGLWTSICVTKDDVGFQARNHEDRRPTPSWACLMSTCRHSR